MLTLITIITQFPNMYVLTIFCREDINQWLWEVLESTRVFHQSVLTPSKPWWYGPEHCHATACIQTTGIQPYFSTVSCWHHIPLEQHFHTASPKSFWTQTEHKKRPTVILLPWWINECGCLDNIRALRGREGDTPQCLLNTSENTGTWNIGIWSSYCTLKILRVWKYFCQ